MALRQWPDIDRKDLPLDHNRNPMTRLTPEGQRVLGEICRRYGVRDETGLALLDALSHTNGTMAQFNLPELGGAGQWMSSGMTMVGDMFNHSLKALVNGLCAELATLLSSAPFQPSPGLPGGGPFMDNGGGSAGHWWPAWLGLPSWQGSQNNLRYAFFPATNRLAVEINGDVGIYDTGGFVLTGVGQQQSGYGSSLTLTGPGGIVTLDRLRRVDEGLARAPTGGTFESPPPVSEPMSGGGPSVSAPYPDAPQTPESGDAPDERLSGTQWLYAPKAGAVATPVTLGVDGVLAGIENDALRYWAVEDGMLWFYAADGRATACFKRVIRGAEGVQIVGTSPPETGAPVVLRACAPRPAVSPGPASPGSTVLELRLDVCAHPWAFGVRTGATIATVRLLRDGSLSGTSRPTESSWRLDGGQLVFLHRSGRPTTRFTTIEVRDSLWTLSGSCLANHRIVHELCQMPSEP